MKNAIHADYCAVPPGGFTERILAAQRRRLFDAFMAFKQEAADDTVLTVGLAPNVLIDKPDYMLAWADAAQRARMTAHAIDMPTPGSRQAEIRLPFADRAFDWVCCNEVIEHAGRTERQYALVKELYRVARKGVFVSTANRRHPLGFHTGLPLLQLLPENWWRRLLRWCGKGQWANPSMFNPLDAAALYRFASLLPGKPRHDVGHKRVGGVKAHFFLMITR